MATNNIDSVPKLDVLYDELRDCGVDESFLPKIPNPTKTDYVQYWINRPGFRLLTFMNHSRKYVGVALVCRGGNAGRAVEQLKTEKDAIESDITSTAARKGLSKVSLKSDFPPCLLASFTPTISIESSSIFIISYSVKAATDAAESASISTPVLYIAFTCVSTSMRSSRISNRQSMKSSGTG